MLKLFIGPAVLLAAWLPLAGFDGSPVADAAANRDLAALKKLIGGKADVNAAQADGSTALLWAVHRGDAEAVDLLLKAGADVKEANRLNATPLYLAAEAGNAEIAGKLLAAGAIPIRQCSQRARRRSCLPRARATWRRCDCCWTKAPTLTPRIR